MESNSTVQALPVWVWLSFTIVLVGLITLIYTRGNWRTTLSFVGLALLTVLGITAFDAWNAYFKLHFIGQYDQLGIPFRQAGPGWDMFFAAWPLWLLPSCLVGFIAAGVTWFILYEPQKIEVESAIDIEEPIRETTSVMKRKLEVTSLKQQLDISHQHIEELMEATKKQADKIIELEDEMYQSKEKDESHINLDAELAEKEQRISELTDLTFEQAEEIVRLKDELNKGN